MLDQLQRLNVKLTGTARGLSSLNTVLPARLGAGLPGLGAQAALRGCAVKLLTLEAKEGSNSAAPHA
jgi:hypothetical protein